LVDFLGKENLVDTLKLPGPYTVFAPTDAAFEAIATVTGELTSEELTDILTYHVLNGKVDSSQLVNGPVNTLFATHELTVAVAETGVTITGQDGGTATVTMADVECSNGVVHIVSAVLIPTGVGVMDIVATAQATPSLSSLVDFLGQENLVDTLKLPGPYTVFAPTDAAFTVVQSTIAGLTSTKLRDVLTYHVHNEKVDSSQLIDGQIVTTLFTSHDLTVAKSGTTVTIEDQSGNTATVTVADVECANGVVHIVDHVLIPILASQTPSSAAEIYIQT